MLCYIIGVIFKAQEFYIQHQDSQNSFEKSWAKFNITCLNKINGLYFNIWQSKILD